MKKLALHILIAVGALVTTTASAAWVFDSGAKTLTDGNWSFANVVVATVNGVQGLRIQGAATHIGSGTVVDFTTCETDTGYKVVRQDGESLRTVCTEYIGPDVTVLASLFYGNTVLTSITVSTNITSIGTVKGCTAIVAVKTTDGDSVFPLLTSLAKDFADKCSKLEGDFEFPAVAHINFSKLFTSCSKVTSVKFANAVDMGGSGNGSRYAFSGCTALREFYAPNLVTIDGATSGDLFYGCSSLTNITVGAGCKWTGTVGDNTFNGCSNLTSLDGIDFSEVTSVGAAAFLNCAVRGKLSVQVAASIAYQAFKGSKFDEVYAPSAATIGIVNGETFNGCANLAKITIGNIVGTDGKTPKKAIMSLKSTGSDIYLTGTTVPTGFNDAYWLQPSGTTLATMNARVWMKTGTGATWEAWKTAFSGTNGFVEAKDFDATYTGAATYPGSEITLGCFNNLNGGYAWICEWATIDAVIVCPEGVIVASVVSGGLTIEPDANGWYKVEDGALLDITYETETGYKFADGTVSLTIYGVPAAAAIPTSVCTKQCVKCAAKIGENYYITLGEAFAAGGDVYLQKDLLVDVTVTVPAGKNVKLYGGTFTVTAESAQPFEVLGSFMILGGIFGFDPTAYLASGYIATARGTSPETWIVESNSNVADFTVDTADFGEYHLASVRLVCDAGITPITNGTVVTWSVVKGMEFSVVFTAADEYAFGDDKDYQVSYASGIDSGVEFDLALLPPMKHQAPWYFVDSELKNKITDGNWTLPVLQVTKTSAAGDSYTGWEVGTPTAGSGELDLSAVRDHTDYDVISVAANAFSGNTSITLFKGPSTVYLNYGVFNGTTALTSVTLSPNLFYIGGRAFMNATALQDIVPTVFPKFETLNITERYNFNRCTVAGNFTFGRLKIVPQNAFQDCTHITSVSMPECERVLQNAFATCSSLTNFFGPKVVDLQPASLETCSKLETVVFSTAITNLSSCMYLDGALVSIPEANWTNLLTMGGSNFELAKYPLGDVRVPLLTTFAGRNFHGSKITSCYALNVETMGEYVFANCSMITNVTIKGSAGCFTAYNVFLGATSLRDIYWLGAEAPTALRAYSLSAGGSQTPVVVHVVKGKDIDGWWAICTKTKSEMDADNNVDAYKALARQTGVRWNSRLIGFIGGSLTVNATTGVVTAAGDAQNNCCWVVDDGSTGMMVLVR